MSQVNVSLKPDGKPEELQSAKDEAIKQGGTIVHEFKLNPGFTVQFPPETYHTLKTSESIAVEEDAEVTTQ